MITGAQRAQDSRTPSTAENRDLYTQVRENAAAALLHDANLIVRLGLTPDADDWRAATRRMARAAQQLDQMDAALGALDTQPGAAR